MDVFLWPEMYLGLDAIARKAWIGHRCIFRLAISRKCGILLDMTSIHIDTHQFVKGLVNAGIPEEQAEAILEGLERIDLKGVASKQDAAAIDHKIASLREDMKEMKADIFKWMFTSQFVAAGLIVGLIKLL